MTPARAGTPDQRALGVRAAAAAAPDWAALAQAARACTACPELAASRRTVVVGTAPPGARLLLLGEAPGAQEDETGEPFVGRSGQLLDRLLAEVGVDRSSVAVLNTLKCRPPGNRPPHPLESTRCRGWAERQLALLEPAVVVALGLSATRWFLGPTALAPVRGRLHDAGGRRVLPTYHPSAALRFGPDGEPLRLLREDLALAARRRPEARAPVTVVATGAASGQLVVDGLWGELRDVDGAPDASWLAEAGARAREAGALDLRVPADPDGRWAALGFAPLDPSSAELVLPLDVDLDGVEATRALGARLAAALRPGDLLVLSGPLGAGKTALTQGIGGALGVRGAVTSPTFVLARAHRGPLPLLHVDAYRLREARGGAATVLADLDLEDALSDAVVVVEWGEGLVEDMADARLHILLDRPAAQAEDRRTVRVRAHGARWAASARR